MEKKHKTKGKSDFFLPSYYFPPSLPGKNIINTHTQIEITQSTQTEEALKKTATFFEPNKLSISKHQNKKTLIVFNKNLLPPCNFGAVKLKNLNLPLKQ